MDPDQVAQAITPRTKAIIPVDFGGMPCRYAELRKVIHDAPRFAASNPTQEQLGRLLMITDAAHSLGAAYNGKPAALQADFTAFSFHAVKNLTTAEGGAVCINVPGFEADDLHRWFTLMSLFGQSKDALTKQSGGSWEYDIVADGYKCNMPDVLAAIGLVELERYESDMLPRRMHITSLYKELLTDADRFELPLFADEHRASSHHLFPLRVKGIHADDRSRIIDRAYAEGVDLNVHFKPLPLLSYYQSLGYRAEDFPVAIDSYSREISLPVYYDLTDEMVERVVAVLNEALRT
jgi:dTDP-4-amino-4,6-dideoxygalactose transaminase